MTLKQKANCSAIAFHYGATKQRIQAIQELSELICLLSRRPEQEDDSFKQSVIDELADSRIMLQQLQTLFRINNDELSNRIDYKLNRQLRRMNDEVLTYDP